LTLKQQAATGRQWFTLSRLATFALTLAGILALPAILVLLASFVEILVMPPVMEYKNVPFPVGTPVVLPGQPVTFIVDRCANDLLSPSPVIYTFTRELVNDDSGVRTGIPDGSSDVDRGCEYGFESKLNIIPPNTPDGHYYVQGSSTAVGRFKTTQIRWRSQVFEVRKES
jgi:hypothetical protein